MNAETYRQFCLSFPGVTEDLPFGPDVLVFRLLGKIFSLSPIEPFSSINLKCDPERAVQMRELYEGITPGYHMNKKHWNTVLTDGSVPETVIRELATHSYELVASSLPKADREKLRILKAKQTKK